MREEPVRDHYESPDIELINYKVYKRVCNTCCEMEDCDMQMTNHKIG
jgi:hypothetical protein